MKIIFFLFTEICGSRCHLTNKAKNERVQIASKMKNKIFQQNFTGNYGPIARKFRRTENIMHISFEHLVFEHLSSLLYYKIQIVLFLYILTGYLTSYWVI